MCPRPEKTCVVWIGRKCYALKSVLRMDERQRDAKVRKFFLHSPLSYPLLHWNPPPLPTPLSILVSFTFLAMKVYQEPKIAAKYTENTINSHPLKTSTPQASSVQQLNLYRTYQGCLSSLWADHCHTVPCLLEYMVRVSQFWKIPASLFPSVSHVFMVCKNQ